MSTAKATALRSMHPALERRWARALSVLLASLLVAFLHGAAQAAPLARSIDSVAITVNDMDRAIGFYTDVLSFELESQDEIAGEDYERLYGVFGMRARTAVLRLGDERIELIEFLAPRGRPTPPDSRSNDRWFQHVAIIVSDMDRAYTHLRQHKVTHASSGPQLLPAWNPNAGGIAAFYFRDPDGNHLEILQFPPDKGDPRWRRKDRLFLGIDHTAIVTADTDASLAFYRDALGLAVAGESENYGPEQERLNNVFGARLRITALRAPEGPGVELLEYLAPRTGRAMPEDTRANDDWHWHVNVTADVAQADRTIRVQRHAYVSPGPVDSRDGIALMVRDPDGHAVLLRQRGAIASSLTLPRNARE